MQRKRQLAQNLPLFYLSQSCQQNEASLLDSEQSRALSEYEHIASDHPNIRFHLPYTNSFAEKVGRGVPPLERYHDAFEYDEAAGSNSARLVPTSTQIAQGPEHSHRLPLDTAYLDPETDRRPSDVSLHISIALPAIKPIYRQQRLHLSLCTDQPQLAELDALSLSPRTPVSASARRATSPVNLLSPCRSSSRHSKW
jgi:hypothetical protein